MVLRTDSAVTTRPNFAQTFIPAKAGIQEFGRL